jgi:hypothetical protein
MLGLVIAVAVRPVGGGANIPDSGGPEGDTLQRVRGLIAGTLVGIPLGGFMMFWLHAVVWAAALGGGVVAVGIFAVVSTRSDVRDEAADAAWREAAPDLPPVSDRIHLENRGAALSPPEARPKASPSSADPHGAGPIGAANNGSESK